MLNVFKLQNAIQESASGASVEMASIEPYRFIGTMEEATYEFHQNLLAESIELKSFVNSADEIMIEAAVSNPGVIGVLTENVFDNVWSKLDSFFQKLKKMVAGIIEKLKAYFYAYTHKTDKWLELMESKVREAQAREGFANQKYTLTKWESSYFSNGENSLMYKGLWNLLVFEDNGIKKLEGLKSDLKAYADAHKAASDASDKDAVEARSVSRLDTAKIENDNTKWHEEFPSRLAKHMGVKGDFTKIDDVWAAVKKMATGGETGEFAMTSSKVDDMLKDIKDGGKSIDALKKAYDKHLKQLNDDHNEIKKHFKVKDILDGDANGSVNAQIKSDLQTQARLIMGRYTTLEAAANKARQLNIDFLKGMTTEYMKALTSAASFKVKKEKKEEKPAEKK